MLLATCPSTCEELPADRLSERRKPDPSTRASDGNAGYLSANHSVIRDACSLPSPVLQVGRHGAERRGSRTQS